MKIKEITLISLITHFIITAIFQQPLYFSALAIILFIYLILTVISERRLEKEIDSVRGRLEELYDDNIELQKHSINTELNYLNEISILKNELDLHKEDSTPFAEESKQCDRCGNNMRATAKMWICDNCKRRIKKGDE